ncbi:hypothetical protein Y1Q_0004771 [Alligator mississippiensis]|uniref:glutathione transferase n=1 Tax=Alligator mississippiensis TaxID=8496 RepID=A0A151NLK5_ALLMI|nr:hypothetical protein Y1Q_0004771 [Alligator mississippiensis]
MPVHAQSVLILKFLLMDDGKRLTQLIPPAGLSDSSGCLGPIISPLCWIWNLLWWMPLDDVIFRAMLHALIPVILFAIYSWNLKRGSMSGKPKLTYFNGRGRMESIRWLLAAAGVEFEEDFLETREQYLKLIQDGHLLFDQVPLVEIDGMKMVQTKAILSYIAGKHNLYGKGLKERAL